MAALNSEEHYHEIQREYHILTKPEKDEAKDNKIYMNDIFPKFKYDATRVEKEWDE